VDYKTAWFMCHRVRKAMEEEPLAGLLGGGGGTVEADETFVGGKPRKVAGGKTKGGDKSIVFVLVERGGRARSEVVPDVTAATLKDAIKAEVAKSAAMMTDGLLSYTGLGKDFARHDVIDHERAYAIGDVHINTAESYFSLFKRGLIGSFHHVSRKHLPRYLAEFDFRWNLRKTPDGARFAEAVKAVAGKRLYYRTPKGSRAAGCDAT
jgi:transposase-like protein